MDEIENKAPTVYPLNQIYFYLTGSCNLRCRHCWIEPRYASESSKPEGIDPGVFENILDQALPLGLNGVKLTGGEPLLHPRIDLLLDHIRRKNLHLTMETNGTLCHPELAERLGDFPDVSISVSLDGADAGIHDWVRGKEGSFRAAIEGIENLVRYGIHPQIIMTVMRCNKDHLTDLVRLAESVGAGSVKFNVLQPTARGAQLHKAGETLEIGELIALGKWVDGELSATTGLSLCFHQPPAFRGLGFMFSKTGDGCHSCGILGILGVLSEGSYALCGIGTTIAELVFGHALKDSLHDVWLNNPVLRQIREGLPQKLTGACARCLMKNICLGSCIAQNYYRDRNLWAPFWFCEEAYQKGLFPATRMRPEEISDGCGLTR